jgi:hypothetical protein
MELPMTPDFSQPTFTFDTEEILRQQRGGFTAYEGKEGFVTFYLADVRDEEKSAEAGYEVKRKEEYCRIQFQSSKDCWDQPVREVDKTRYPLAYAKFKAGQKGLDMGTATPLEDWPQIASNQSKINELHSAGFKSVEQIANCIDPQMPFMGADASSLRKSAKEFLATKNEGITASQLRAEKEELEAKLAQQNAVVLELLARMDKLENGGKPKK